jgi:hypothetical protein
VWQGRAEEVDGNSINILEMLSSEAMPFGRLLPPLAMKFLFYTYSALRLFFMGFFLA